MNGLKSFLRRLDVLSQQALTTAIGLLGAGLLGLFSGAPDWTEAAVWSGVGVSLLVRVLSGLWSWALDGDAEPPEDGVPEPARAEDGTDTDTAARPPDSAARPAGTPAEPRGTGAPAAAAAEPSIGRRIVRGLALPAAVLVITACAALWPLSRSCEAPTGIAVATTPDGQPALKAAAASYAQLRAEESGAFGRHCRKVRIIVYAVPDGQKMREALTGVWDPRLGPLPNLWVPGSTSEALLVENDLGSGGPVLAGIGSPGADAGGGGAAPSSGPASTAPSPRAPAVTAANGPVLRVTDIEVGEWTRLSPLVLALPESMAERVTAGDADDAVVENPYARLREEFGHGGVQVVRADPRDSGAALLHTAFLYHDRGAITRNGGIKADRRAAEVEAELAPQAAAGGRDLVCQVARGADDSVPTAALTTEAAVYEASVASRWKAACPGAEEAHEEITALYSPRLPVLDHPVVRISGVSVTEPGGSERPVTESAAVAEEVDRFEKYLNSLRDNRDMGAFTETFSNDEARATPKGVYEGYRDQRGNGVVATRVEGAPATIPNMRGDPEAWSAKAAGVLRLHSQGRVGTVLLALDTSTSMAVPGRKFTTAADEAAELVGAAGTKEALGLWAFPAGSGPSALDAATAVALDRWGGRAEDRFTAALKPLAPVKESTPLRDVIADGAQALHEWSRAAEAESGVGSRSGAQGRPPPMLIVLTDGIGAPAQGGLSQASMERRLEETDVRVRVLAVGDETRRWGGVGACDIGVIPELTGHEQVECVPADTERPGEAAVALLNEARRF